MLTHSAAHRSFSPKFDPVPSDKAKTQGRALKPQIAFCNPGAKESATNTTKRCLKERSAQQTIKQNHFLPRDPCWLTENL